MIVLFYSMFETFVALNYIPELCACVGAKPPVARWEVRGVVAVTIVYYNVACVQSLLWLYVSKKRRVTA